MFLLPPIIACALRKVDHRLVVITDLTWEFESVPGEDLSVEFRVLRAEAVNLLTALAHIPETAPRVARHAGLALRMVAQAYGRFAPGLREGVRLAGGGGTVAGWRLVLDLEAGQPARSKRAGSSSAEGETVPKTSPQLMLALLRLIEKLATVPGGREGLYQAARNACAKNGSDDKEGLPLFFVAPRADAGINDLLRDTVPPPPSPFKEVKVPEKEDIQERGYFV